MVAVAAEAALARHAGAVGRGVRNGCFQGVESVDHVVRPACCRTRPQPPSVLQFRCACISCTWSYALTLYKGGMHPIMSQVHARTVNGVSERKEVDLEYCDPAGLDEILAEGRQAPDQDLYRCVYWAAMPLPQTGMPYGRLLCTTWPGVVERLACRVSAGKCYVHAGERLWRMGRLVSTFGCNHVNQLFLLKLSC